MRLIKDAVRGSIVDFEVVFHDANSDPITPANAVLKIAYVVNGAVSSNIMIMTQNSTTNAYTGSWNTSGIDGGVVDWVVIAYDSNAVSMAANAGSFRVETNRATP